jgi:hypothetical protein
MGKVQHWRGFQSIFGLKGAPMLDFVALLRGEARALRGGRARSPPARDCPQTPPTRAREHRLSHPRVRAARGFGFDQHVRAASGRHDEIDFQPLLIAKIVKLAPSPLVDLRLDDFSRDRAFKKRVRFYYLLFEQKGNVFHLSFLISNIK